MDIKIDNNIKHYISGWLSGMTAVLVSHPIDTIKTNVQEKKPINYGFRSLYKGLLAPLIGVGLEKAIVFGTYESSIRYTNSDIISGAISGLTASFIVTPFERIKILLQTNQKLEKEMFNRKFLFQGLSATFYRETPGFAIYFATYNFLKSLRHDWLSIHYLNQESVPKISVIESFLFGAVAGSTAWVFIYPQDRIKTHLQAIKDRQLGFVEGFREVLKDGGYRGLYRGFHFALMRAVPLHATAFMTMELCKKYLY